MKILVLNGSPKGDLSVTMQYIHYIKKFVSNHELKIIHIAQQIDTLQKNDQFFQDIINEIDSSEGIIWAFPLYFGLVASQYKRFIELIHERHAATAFKGKYAAILTTSIHFSDHTAINYMNAICDDLEMNFVDAFSLHMNDLNNKNIRKNLLLFARNYFDMIETNSFTFKNYQPLTYEPPRYIAQATKATIDTRGKKIVILTDAWENNNLKNMIEQFRHYFVYPVDLVNLQDITIKGGCIGCMNCSYNYECIYTGKDDFIDFYNTTLKTADILLFAGKITDRYLSSTWKRFFDRSFFNTHSPSLAGKQIGFIITGPLKQVSNLRQLLEIYSQWQHLNLVGFVTDESAAAPEIEHQLYTLAYQLTKLSTINYSKPNNFLGVSTWKLFRDEMWGELRFPFVADYKTYKALKVYDFPQKNYKSRIKNAIFLLLLKIPFLRKEIYAKIPVQMIKPLAKIVEESQQ